MIGNLKALGVAVVAVLAMSAVAAPAAQAENLFHSESTNTTLTVTQESQEGTALAHSVWELAGASITCKGFHGEAFWSAQTNTTIHLENIKYTNCSFLGVTVTLNMHQCDFTYTSHVGVTNFKIVNTTSGKTCAEEKISWAAPGCSIQIGPQEELHEINYHNIGQGTTREITITHNLTSIVYEATGFLCPKQGQFSDGKVSTANLIVTGEITGQQTHTGVWWE